MSWDSLLWKPSLRKPVKPVEVCLCGQITRTRLALLNKTFTQRWRSEIDKEQTRTKWYNPGLASDHIKQTEASWILVITECKSSYLPDICAHQGIRGSCWSKNIGEHWADEISSFSLMTGHEDEWQSGLSVSHVPGRILCAHHDMTIWAVSLIHSGGEHGKPLMVIHTTPQAWGLFPSHHAPQATVSWAEAMK